MKYVETITKETNISKSEKIYNKNGDIASNNEKIFAREIITALENGGTQRKYFIMTHNNVPYDPYGIDSHREGRNLRIELKTSNKDSLYYYILYLKTRNSLYLTRTNRSFINA
jgi:hypothetical protein